MTPGTNGLGRGDPRRILKSVVAALCVLGAVAFWIWSQDSERRAIHRLPESARAEVYARTLANFQAVCGVPDLALEEYCREQARLLLEFPECDGACRALASGRIAR